MGMFDFFTDDDYDFPGRLQEVGAYMEGEGGIAAALKEDRLKRQAARKLAIKRQKAIDNIAEKRPDLRAMLEANPESIDDYFRLSFSDELRQLQEKRVQAIELEQYNRKRKDELSDLDIAKKYERDKLVEQRAHDKKLFDALPENVRRAEYANDFEIYKNKVQAPGMGERGNIDPKTGFLRMKLRDPNVSPQEASQVWDQVNMGAKTDIVGGLDAQRLAKQQADLQQRQFEDDPKRQFRMAQSEQYGKLANEYDALARLRNADITRPKTTAELSQSFQMPELPQAPTPGPMPAPPRTPEQAPQGLLGFLNQAANAPTKEQYTAGGMFGVPDITQQEAVSGLSAAAREEAVPDFAANRDALREKPPTSYLEYQRAQKDPAYKQFLYEQHPGMEMVMGPDGTVTWRQGVRGGRKEGDLTEGQQRSIKIWTGAQEAMSYARDNFKELNLMQNRVGNLVEGATIPGTNIKAGGTWMMTEKGQAVRAATVQTLQSYIYSLSGQQAPDQEVERIFDIIIPKIGDGPEALRIKELIFNDYIKSIEYNAKGLAGPGAQIGSLDDAINIAGGKYRSRIQADIARAERIKGSKLSDPELSQIVKLYIQQDLNDIANKAKAKLNAIDAFE